MEKINPILIIKYLNSLLAIDPVAISSLINCRFQTNEALCNHETVQVMKLDDDTSVVGLLGILNGLCGKDENNDGFVVACIDENNNVIRFCHKDDVK